MPPPGLPEQTPAQRVLGWAVAVIMAVCALSVVAYFGLALTSSREPIGEAIYAIPARHGRDFYVTHFWATALRASLVFWAAFFGLGTWFLIADKIKKR
jgi:hypothetical protein